MENDQLRTLIGKSRAEAELALADDTRDIRWERPGGRYTLRVMTDRIRVVLDDADRVKAVLVG